ncbi:hypothetical protein MKW94_029433 [Papaver nudicaule]|uniref:Cation/H+ exchanger domain-containing protein n=1 Tax=Papaver nudicaule TaxID=74823 RepID=A0AA41UUX4_PAPNU|nr:hypothetical protein [Papaver nudicaule]
MTFNKTHIEASSNGAWQGDNPLNYALPLLIIQTLLVLFVSHSLALVLKPLRQPKVIAEILGGILLGPSALGRNKAYLDRIFPPWSQPILETVASIGLLFFLFLVGLELDLNSIRRSGKRAFSIALAGILVPFICGTGVAIILRKTVQGEQNVGFAQFVVFMGVSLSITAFPVLARILAELKLLTTQVGETAMAAAAFNDVVAWVLLALAVALSEGGDHKKKPLVSVWVLVCGIAFVIVMLFAVRPVMAWVSKRSSSKHHGADETYICLTLAGVMLSGFATDLIGIHSIFGAFIFGLTIPKGEFAGRLIRRTEDFVTGLLLPLYFASSGLKTDVTKMHGLEAWGLLVLVITAACAGKIVGTSFVAMMHKIPVREAITLGFLMNTKGLVELIVLNIGKEKKVLNDETFAILILMSIFATFITTPSVMVIYKPAARSASSCNTRRKQQTEFPSCPQFSNNSDKKNLRILACVHGMGNIPSLIKLVDSTRSAQASPIKLYVMHFMELTERSSSILMVQRTRRNGLPFINRICKGTESVDRVSAAFQGYSSNQLGRVKVRHMTTISDLPTMHEDVCHVAEEKRVTMMILPFHKRARRDEGGDIQVENVGPGWRAVNQCLLKHAPCSVAVLVDRGLSCNSRDDDITGPPAVAQRVCVVFFGGPDDRQALEFGGRMADHPGVDVTVVRFAEQIVTENKIIILDSLSTTADPEKELDEKAITEFRKRRDRLTVYIEKEAERIGEGVLTIGRSGEYGLIVTGRSQLQTRMVAELSKEHATEYEELGPIGDILASTGNGVTSSVLVIQQHSIEPNDPAPKILALAPEDFSSSSKTGAPLDISEAVNSG